MKLIKENKNKQRAIYKMSDRIRKIWYAKDYHWVIEHFNLLQKINPGYVLLNGRTSDYVFIDYKVIKGVTASTLPHTDKFIKKIYDFCLNNIETTQPYAHGDWVLSNIIVDQDQLTLCDWDNVGIYDKQEAIKKMHSDLKSAFGEKIKI
jgi:RIO-like serine/threonine protein kinase